MKSWWWKIVTIIILVYVVIGGLLLDVPRLNILNETIRNIHFHVPMWFGMILLLLTSMVYAILYLRSGDTKADIKSETFAKVGLLYGILGLATGIIWAKFTWGAWWSGDPKQNASVIGMLIYLAYFILRGSLEDPDQKARISSVYNIFAFASLIPLLFILPRLTDSLHPGSGGNPGFNTYDLDSRLRMVFYPAVIGWTLLGVWITQVRYRTKILKIKKIETSTGNPTGFTNK